MTHFKEFTRRETKARIPHQCAECLGGIDKGTVYIRNGQQMGREFSTVARHSDCLLVADRFAGLLETGLGFRFFLSFGIKKKTRHIADHPRQHRRRISGRAWAACAFGGVSVSVTSTGQHVSVLGRSYVVGRTEGGELWLCSASH